MELFGPVNLVALKAEESGRMAQHAHGLICSRFFKLYNIIELMDKDYELVMNWMGCVATSVLGSCCEYAIKMACARKVTHALEVVVGDLITIKHEFLGSWRQPISH